MNILVWQYIQMPYFVSIIRSFLIFYFMGLVIHHWRKFLKQILSIAIDNLQFRLVFTSVKFCCKKVWWCVFYYVPSNKVLCLSKNWWKKYQSISSKYESFRMIFKLVRKSTFEQNYTFYVIIWDFFGRAQSENNFKLFFFSIMLHLQSLTPWIALLVNFGLPGEKLITSTILICN